MMITGTQAGMADARRSSSCQNMIAESADTIYIISAEPTVRSTIGRVGAGLFINRPRANASSICDQRTPAKWRGTRNGPGACPEHDIAHEHRPRRLSKGLPAALYTPSRRCDGRAYGHIALWNDHHSYTRDGARSRMCVRDQACVDSAVGVHVRCMHACSHARSGYDQLC